MPSSARCSGPSQPSRLALCLASDCYCHFTSPIRRYPDLTVHRLLDAVIQGRPPAADYDALVTLGEHCSEREQRAEDAERELIKLKLLAYFSTRIGEEMNAVVTGVESYGLFAQGVELPAEGFVHVDSADDHYQFDRDPHARRVRARVSARRPPAGGGRPGRHRPPPARFPRRPPAETHGGQAGPQKDCPETPQFVARR